MEQTWYMYWYLHKLTWKPLSSILYLAWQSLSIRHQKQYVVPSPTSNIYTSYNKRKIEWCNKQGISSEDIENHRVLVCENILKTMQVLNEKCVCVMPWPRIANNQVQGLSVSSMPINSSVKCLPVVLIVVSLFPRGKTSCKIISHPVAYTSAWFLMFLRKAVHHKSRQFTNKYHPHGSCVASHNSFQDLHPLCLSY